MRWMRIALAVSVLLNVWLVSSLQRVENERYAMSIGLCVDPADKVPDASCVKSQQTRAGWYWHVFFAMADTL
jgi:hypothetical protein